MNLFDGSIPIGTLLLLLLCVGIALGFEFVNGFHDTANAVATVIYTKSLPPTAAVIWCGILNFIGVMVGGVGVAFGIVHLLPVDLLINIGSSAGLLMVLSLLLAAVIWNVGTWYFGLPSSSSHALIGSILGVGLASSLFTGKGFGSGVNWSKAQDIGLSLLVSPLIGFVLAGLLLLLLKSIVRIPKLYEEPSKTDAPPWWIRGILIITCTLVSLFHGSNDGQKGMGLIMLILIGLLPTAFGVNTELKADDISKTTSAITAARPILAKDTGADAGKILAEMDAISSILNGKSDLKSLAGEQKTTLRANILKLDGQIKKYAEGANLSEDDKKTVDTARKTLANIVDYVAGWIPIAVAIALGFGTTVGWQRIVVTVGEKIGKTHLTYAQGAAAELVAAVMIFAADLLHLPVSTTHVLSSGVAGTMVANKSGLEPSTVRSIALAWVLTLPVTILLSGGLFLLTAGWSLRGKGITPPPPAEYRVPNRTDDVSGLRNQTDYQLENTKHRGVTKP